MFCTSCGKELREGVKFCTSCGAPVDAAEGGAQSAVAAAPQASPNPQRNPVQPQAQSGSPAQTGESKPTAAAGNKPSDWEKVFKATDGVEDYFAIDNVHQLIFVNNYLYLPWSQIISFERLKDETQVNRHGVRRVRRLKQVDKAMEIAVKIVTRDPQNPQIRIDLIGRAVKKSSIAYANAEANAQKIMTLLTVAMDTIKSEQAAQAAQPVVNQQGSPAEEIQKYKALMDDGVITQEEFDAKKKQLLGL